VSASSGILNRLSLGSPSAENEVPDLNAYYLRTEAFNQASRGEATLVVGRKGSGKSAIFFRIRDNENNRIDNLVLDLRPEDYQLIKFKEDVLQHLAAGTFKHTGFFGGRSVIILS
jgi:hypothetical protein